jgi:hypothetical protein
VRGPLFAQRPHDRLQHVVGTKQRIVIPEPKHAKALRLQVSRSLLVVRLPLHMPAAIQLHYQLGFHATEIRVIPRHRMLPPEFHAELRRTQARPQLALGDGLVTA